MDQDPILARKSIILYVVNLGTSRYSKNPGTWLPPLAGLGSVNLASSCRTGWSFTVVASVSNTSILDYGESTQCLSGSSKWSGSRSDTMKLDILLHIPKLY